jgi:serine protease Do
VKRKAKQQRSVAYHPLQTFVPIIRQARGSVVYIRVIKNKRRYGTRGWAPPFYQEESVDLQSIGSGFVVHPNGYLLTSEHVVRNAEEIEVIWPDGHTQQAAVARSDTERDLCLLKVNPHRKLHPLNIGSSSRCHLGEWVIAIGNPMGLAQTITTGIISAKDRKLQLGENLYGDILQTDCTIHPGNSGGPLIDTRGKVVGMNAFVIKSHAGLAFAIGADSLKEWIRKR